MLASRAGDLEIVQGIVALGAEIDKPTNVGDVDHMMVRHYLMFVTDNRNCGHL